MSETEIQPRTQLGLRRQLGLGDLVLAQVLCVVGSSWVGVSAGLGRAQMLFWLGVMLAFYLPMAASVIGLNREMPLEGGLYVWAHRAFGDLGGFLTAWNILIYAIAVTAAILYAVPSEIAYLIGPSATWLPENRPVSLAIVTATVAGVTLAAILALDVGKWVQNIGGISILAVFAVLILLPLCGLARHQPIVWSPLSFAAPPRDLRTLALFGQIMFGGLCGLEYIAILAGESKQPARTIGQSVWIASPIICAMFILGTSTVVAYVPRNSIDFIAPIPQTMRAALGQTGIGNLIAMTAIFCIELRLLGASSMIFTGATRLPMTAGWDKLVPRWFARLHPRWRTPVNSIACMALLIFLLLVLANVDVHAQEAYQLLSNASTTHYEIAYLAMFAVPLSGRAACRPSQKKALIFMPSSFTNQTARLVVAHNLGTVRTLGRVPIMSLHKRFLFATLFTIVALTAAGKISVYKTGFDVPKPTTWLRAPVTAAAALYCYRSQPANKPSRWLKALRTKGELLPALFTPIQFKNPESLGVGKLLVASRGLGDPHFAETVVLLVRYDENGVLGLVINRRTDVPLSRVLDLEAAKDRTDPVYLGGPVGPSAVFALFESSAKIEKAENIFGGVYLISDKALFEQTISSRPDPSVFHVYLGYAGWTQNQLRTEVRLGGWFVFPADSATVFNSDPDSLWLQMIHKTELRLAKLSPPRKPPGADPMCMTQPEFARFVSSESESAARFIKAAGIKPQEGP